MKVCPNCHNNIEDSAMFCTVCGANQSTAQNTQQVPPQPQVQSAQQVPPQYMPPNSPEQNNQVPPQSVPYYAAPVQRPVEKYDFSDDFKQEDIAENKLMAMIVYLLGLVGIALAFLKKSDSPYLDFHLKQGLKLIIVEAIVLFATVLLGWTVIVAVAGAIALVILAVIRIICFVDVCKGKAKTPVIIREFGFLK